MHAKKKIAYCLVLCCMPIVDIELMTRRFGVTIVERGSSVVECRTRNRESPDSNPSLLPFQNLGIFVLSTDAPFHSAV